MASLRITTEERPSEITLKLEGNISGAQVGEFQKTWSLLSHTLGRKKLQIDLCDVTQMNAAAREILAEIYRRTGAKFLADTPLTKYFAEEAQRGTRKSEEV